MIRCRGGAPSKTAATLAYAPVEPGRPDSPSETCLAMTGQVEPGIFYIDLQRVI